MVWFAALIAVFVSIGFFLNSRSAAGGVEDGRLEPCPRSPNCVCSQDVDNQHAIAPLKPIGPNPIKKLAEMIEQMPRAEIVKETPTYLHATFHSKVFRFVDDVEFFYIPEEQAIHVRSASRVGYSDLGVNRARVENIRNLYQKSAKGAAL